MKTQKTTSLTRKALFWSIIAAGFLFQAGSARSATTTNEYVFSYSQTPGFPDQEMGKLSIFDSGVDTVWTFSANWDNQYNTSAPFVFSLNYSMPTGSISQPSLPLFDVVGNITVKSFGSTGVYFQPSNGPGRFTDGESASWRFLNTAPSQFTAFELHINSIYNGGSVKFTDYAVPEPSTYALLIAAGVGALVWVKRLRRLA